MNGDRDPTAPGGSLYPRRARVYTTPDGQDCLEKVIDTTKVTTKIGAMFAIYEMVGWSRPNKPAAIGHRFLYWVVPAAGLGAMYSTTSCMMGGMRGKDDFWNHGVAGFGCGSIAGAMYGAKRGFAVAFVFAAAASIVKQVFNSGGYLFPESATYSKQHAGYRPMYNERMYKPKEIKAPENY